MSGDEAEALVAGLEPGGPWPGVVDSQDDVSGGVDETARSVEEPLAEGLGLDAGEIAVEEQDLREARRVSGGEDGLEPNLVGGEAGERHPFRAAGVEVADVVLHLGVLTVASLEQVCLAGTVGDHGLVTPAGVIPQAQLGAGVRVLAARSLSCRSAIVRSWYRARRSARRGGACHQY